MTDREEKASEAEALLAELDRIRVSTRHSMLTANWAMLLMWGAIFLGSVVAFVSANETLSFYWIVAAPLGAIASFALGAKADQGASSGHPMWPYVVVVVFMFTGTFGSFFVFEERLAVLVWWLVLVAGFGVIATLDGQRQLLATLALLAGWGVAVYALIDEPGPLYSALAGTFGGVLLGAGAGLRMVRR